MPTEKQSRPNNRDRIEKRQTPMNSTSFVIAIDGPAAAGKGTLSRRCADTYGFHHLDTGLTYRATAKALLDAGLPLDDEATAEKIAREVELAGLDRDMLSQHEIGEAASKIAVMPAVRRALVEAQRRFAEKQPGTVLDGRDIGTVVCPQAPVKLYVTASAEVRARRRFDEILGRGVAADFEAIFEDVKRRDERDMGRADSPLKPAEDAHLLDTSEMSIEAAFQAAKSVIDLALSRNT
jgi:cytidylate kinase